jgi:phosphate-selective porin OprO and OprP
MRHSTLSAALAIALASASLSAFAQNTRDQELAELKAQLAALQAKVAELETRTDAQSDINIATQENLDRMASTQPVVDTKGGIKITSCRPK